MHDEEQGFWVLVRHDDVVDAARQPTVFSNAQGVGLRPAPGGRALANLDPPEHTALRRTAAPAFSRARALDLGSRLSATAERLLDGYELLRTNVGRVDFTEAVVAPYVARGLCDYLALPADDVDHLVAFAAAASRVNGGIGTVDDLRVCTSFVELTTRRLRDDRSALATGVLGPLVQPGGLVDTDPEQALHHLLSAVIGGYETPRHFLSGALLALAGDPSSWSQLRAAPPLVPTAVEELLRYVSPIVGSFRTMAVDHTVAGLTIPAGGRVLLLFGSANHDDTAYDDPDARVLDRFAERPPDHLGFGSGPHFCIGSHFARLLSVRLLTAATQRWPTAEVRGTVDWHPGFLTRGLSGLDLDVSLAGH